MLVPDRAARRQALAHLVARMQRATRGALSERKADLERLRLRLASPDALLAERQQQIDEAEMRLRIQMERALQRRRATLGRLEQRLAARHPNAVLEAARGALGPLEVRLVAAVKRRLQTGHGRLSQRAARLEAMSPLRVLARGYAIATTATGSAVRSADEVAVGETIKVRVHRGALLAEVKGTVTEPGETGGEPHV
jgi:exodeoxyribonuclease VII large subunit